MQLELSTGGIQWIVADVKLIALKFALVGSDGSPDCKNQHAICNSDNLSTCY